MSSIHIPQHPTAAVMSAKRKPQKEFTNEEKLFILDEVARKTCSQEEICAKYGTSRQTIANWKRKRAELEKAVKEEGKGKKKKILANDPLIRVKCAIQKFYDLNEQLPKDLQIPITGM